MARASTGAASAARPLARNSVADAEKVGVRLATGTALTGRVLRRNKMRDVALVKIDALGTRALPVRVKKAAVGGIYTRSALL